MRVSSEMIYGLTGRKVLGVNPPVFDFACFDLWAKPVGLLNLLGWLRARGNEVFLLDSLYEARERPLIYGRWKIGRERVEKPRPYRDIPRRYYRFGLNPEAMRERPSLDPERLSYLTGSVNLTIHPHLVPRIRMSGAMTPLPIS